MAGLTVGGLASGLDTNSIISSLLAIERQPRTKMEWRQGAVQARQDALRDISTKLKALKTASADLKATSMWAPTQSATSSDATKLVVRATGTSATPATHTVDITSLATTTNRTFTYTQRNQDRDLTFGSTSVTITADSTLDQAVSTINAANGDVTAANVNGKLVVTSKAMGNAGNYAWSQPGGGPALLSMDSESIGTQASVKVDGVTHTRDVNVINDVVTGVELDLRQAATGLTVTVGTAAIDKTAVTTKMKAFVEAYNAAADAIRTRMEEKKVVNAANAVDAKKGVLFADSGLGQMMSALRVALADPVSGNPTATDQLADLGITTGAVSATISKDAVNGKLVFDETKFKAALDADPTGVQRLLGGVSGVDGFAQRMDGLVDPWTQVGGSVDGRITSADAEKARLTSSMERLDRRLASKETRLRAQFTALETSLAKLQSQSADLFARLGINNDD